MDINIRKSQSTQKRNEEKEKERMESYLSLNEFCLSYMIFCRYETENGISASESGALGQTAEGDPVLRTSGFYEYVGDDNQRYRVDYTADENGFVATVRE